MKTSLLVVGLCAGLVLIACPAWGVVIGPASGPDWEPDAQLKLGWVFADPKAPQDTGPLAGWDLSVGATPLWDYDAGRNFGGDPAQWYIRLPNVIDNYPVKYFWLSYVYERDNTFENTRNFTNIDWGPFTGYDNFSSEEEWFDASGNPTTVPYDGVLARFTVTLDMFPNPDYEDIWIGVTGDEPSPGGDGFDLLEVYVMTLSIPEPATILLIAFGTSIVVMNRRRFLA